jgi:DNA-directed RNA polymerase
MLRKSATEDILRGRNRDKYDSVPKDTQVKIGALLTYLLKETTKIKGSSGFLENLLEVSYTRRGVTDNYIGVLRINEQFMVDLLKQVEKRDNLFIQLERSLPMIYPPADWVDYEIGGYYQKPTNLMRMQGGYVQEKAVKYADIKNVSQVLNLIGGTAWRINKDVLDVVEEIWNLGGGLAEVPDKFYDYKNYVFEY